MNLPPPMQNLWYCKDVLRNQSNCLFKTVSGHFYLNQDAVEKTITLRQIYIVKFDSNKPGFNRTISLLTDLP